jgi:ABC-type transport system involved in multi-copper enzyme maturation permease subunit
VIDGPFVRAWRQTNQFQLRFAILGTLALGGLSIVGILALGLVDNQYACMGYSSHASSPGCIGIPAFDILYRVVEVLGFLMVGLPVAVGLLLGIVIVGRERQERTLALAFSLEPRRGRWLAERFVLAAAATLAVGFVCGALGFGLASVRFPGIDLSSSFHAYGQWGPLIALRGLLGLSTGLMLGSLTGRALSALMLSTALALGLLVVGEVLVQRTYPATMWVSNGSAPSDNDLRLSNGKVLAPDGRLIEIMDAVALMPEGLWGVDDVAANAWLAEHYPYADLLIPGGSMLDVEIRQAGLLALLGLAFVAISFSALRRSPVR